MRVSKSLDPDQTRCSVRPDLCLKCLLISAADKISSLAGQIQFQLIVQNKFTKLVYLFASYSCFCHLLNYHLKPFTGRLSMLFCTFRCNKT